MRGWSYRSIPRCEVLQGTHGRLLRAVAVAASDEWQVHACGDGAPEPLNPAGIWLVLQQGAAPLGLLKRPRESQLTPKQYPEHHLVKNVLEMLKGALSFARMLSSILRVSHSSTGMVVFTSTISTLLTGKQPGVLVLTIPVSRVSRVSWKSAVYFGGSSDSIW